MNKILVINPGSTSTKLAYFEDLEKVVQVSVDHATEDLKAFEKVANQSDFRLECVKTFLNDNDVKIESLDAVVGRGGLLRPIESGTYRVNEAMLADLKSGQYGEHASNLGGVIAHAIATKAGCDAYIVDPVVVDEMDDVARVSGTPEIERRSIFHALNQKSAAREVAARLGKDYNKCNFIVAHMGGGISVGAHCQGRVIDVNNALDGDGPLSPERAGGLPVGQVMKLCFSGKYTLDELKRHFVGKGGVVSLAGTNDFKKIGDAYVDGGSEYDWVFEAMVYQVSQEIAKHGATLKGKVDAIIITGGIAYDKEFNKLVTERVGFIAPVEIVPGEREMLPLAGGYVSVVEGRETVKEY